MISAPPAPSRRIEISNIVTSAAPRSPCLFERRSFAFNWGIRFITWSSSLINDRVAQNYIGCELYLTLGLVTIGTDSAYCRQRDTDSDDDELRTAWGDFIFSNAG